MEPPKEKNNPKAKAPLKAPIVRKRILLKSALAEPDDQVLETSPPKYPRKRIIKKRYF